MEKILILGAGLMQKKAILSAKKIAKAVVIDKNPFAPCVSLSDEFYPVDLKDKEGILALGFTKDYQLIITGIIVIVAVYADVVARRRKN